MQVVAALIFAALGASGGLSVSGTVTNSQGQPLPGARVFLEPGMEMRLVEGKVAADGTFSFTRLPAGLVGIVAHAEGYAFGGASVKIGIDEPVAGVQVRLSAPQAIAGKVVDVRGHPVAGASLAGILVHQGEAVGIPLLKLNEFGYDLPATSDSGNFSFAFAPTGRTLSLKISHPEYAQETVANVPSGSSGIRATLDAGVLVQGIVRARGSQLPVARAAILVSETGPARSTAMTVTGPDGRFAIKLKPGRYGCQAASAVYRSPGWETLIVTGRQSVQEVALFVAGAGTVRGRVLDAASGNPIAGARVALDAFDNTVDIATTGPQGGFAMNASEGMNVVRVIEAPGYRTAQVMAVKVDVKQGQQVELPDMWLAPIPPFELEVVDDTGQSVSGAVVTLLQPSQYRWRTTGADGRLRFDVAAVPPSGKIVGLVEHPMQAKGALFSLDVAGETKGRVQLFTYASVRGSVYTAEGKPVPGAIVGGAFQEGDASDPTLLFRTISDEAGAFSWNGVTPHMAMVCLASTGASDYARSAPFNLEPGSVRDIGRVIVASSEKGTSLHRKRVAWDRISHASGPVLPPGFAGPAVILFASGEAAPVLIDAFEFAAGLFDTTEVRFVAVAESPDLGSDHRITIARGPVQSTATTYLVDASGTVVLETMGIPPYSAVRRLVESGDFE